MGGSSSEPEGPETGKVENYYEWGAQEAKDRAKKHYDWAKKQGGKLWDRTKPVIDNLNALMSDQATNSAEDRARYEDFFVPYTEEYAERIEGIQGEADEFDASVAKLKQDALDYGSAANKAFMVGQAQAGVTGAFEEAKKNSERTLQAAGVNPAAISSQSLTYELDAEKAAAQAAAGTQAGLDVDETARAMFDEALSREAEALGIDLEISDRRKGLVDLGTTLAEQSMKGAELSGQLGATATASDVAVTDLRNKMRVDSNDFLDTLNAGLTGWSDMLTSSYDAATNRQMAEAQESSGIGGAIGAITPLVTKFLAGGGEVPADASVSAGAIEDDVPTMLTAGEFVFPREAVEVMGTERLYKMRDKLLQQYNDYAAADEEAIPETVI